MKAKAVWKCRYNIVYSLRRVLKQMFIPDHRALGYVIYPLMLFTIYLAGAYATWVIEHTAWIVRFLAYTIAPCALLASIYGRVRYVCIPIHPFLLLIITYILGHRR
jgi:hypothetical protein